MITSVYLVKSRVAYSLVILVFAFATIGCLKVGPISLKSERSKFNQAIQKTNNEQLLLNLVRLKYRDTPF
ncbi:uncharacterized protein METZ01_LOCUS246968, partial [marine metagenome]